MLVDKGIILQIIGSLMKKPILLSQVDKYFILPDDFSSAFERNIFSAIYNLHQNGATRISVIDIDNYLKSHPGAHTLFNNENGIEYLNDCEELSQVENFDYYYQKFKKFNSLNDLEKLGFDVSKIYSYEKTTEAKKINEEFERLTVQDIFGLYKKDISSIEHKYQNRYDNNVVNAAEDIDGLIQQLKDSPEVGANLPGHIINTIVRGGRKGKLYVKSAASGIGKSRALVGDACYLAYPIRFDGVKNKWIQEGSSEKVLYIVTEQDSDEIQTMILSYLSDVDEEKILYANYNEHEGERIRQAAKIMKGYKSNFIIAKIPDPSIVQVQSVVRKYFFENGIDNLFYDYIFSSPGLLAEFRDLRVREDVALLMLSTALKNLASELDIFVETSTQLNRSDESGKNGVKNQNNIRGAISIIDKVDVAYIFDRTTIEEIEALSEFISSTGIIPNQVADLYKVRRSRFTNVRIWSYFDYGTCRKKDLFITSGNYAPVQNFNSVFFMNSDGDACGLLDELNGKCKVKQEAETPLELPSPKKFKVEEVDYF